MAGSLAVQAGKGEGVIPLKMADGIRYYCAAGSHMFRQGTGSGDGCFVPKLGLERGGGFLVDQQGL